MTDYNASTRPYRTLDDIRQRKDELRRQLDRDNEQIDHLWHSLFVKQKDSTRGEFISNIISHSALAIDAFLMVRKLRKTHNTIFQFFKRKKN